MCEKITKEELRYHFGIKYEYYPDDISFGFNLAFQKIFSLNLPYFALHIFKISLIFGWVNLEINENSAILL